MGKGKDSWMMQILYKDFVWTLLRCAPWLVRKEAKERDEKRKGEALY